MKLVVLSLLLVGMLLPTTAGADTVYLKDGQSVWGRSVYEEGDEVVVVRPSGKVRFPKGRVSRVEPVRNTLPPHYLPPAAAGADVRAPATGAVRPSAVSAPLPAATAPDRPAPSTTGGPAPSATGAERAAAPVPAAERAAASVPAPASAASAPASPPSASLSPAEPTVLPPLPPPPR
jgi:hypothetical protein